MTLRLELSICILFCLVSLQASAEPPFGFRMGMSVEELQAQGALKATGRFEYEAKAPIPDARFERYALFVVPGYGLCRVVARTRRVKTDSAGAEYQEDYRRMEASLVASYGEPTNRIDGMRRGVAAQAGQWLAELRRNDRRLHTGWLEKPGLPHELHSVALSAGTFELADYGASQLFLDFRNAPDCMKVVRGPSRSPG